MVVNRRSTTLGVPLHTMKAISLKRIHYYLENLYLIIVN